MGECVSQSEAAVGVGADTGLIAASFHLSPPASSHCHTPPRAVFGCFPGLLECSQPELQLGPQLSAAELS